MPNSEKNAEPSLEILYDVIGGSICDAILTFLGEEPATAIVYPSGQGDNNIGQNFT